VERPCNCPLPHHQLVFEPVLVELSLGGVEFGLEIFRLCAHLVRHHRKSDEHQEAAGRDAGLQHTLAPHPGIPPLEEGHASLALLQSRPRTRNFSLEDGYVGLGLLQFGPRTDNLSLEEGYGSLTSRELSHCRDRASITLSCKKVLCWRYSNV